MTSKLTLVGSSGLQTHHGVGFYCAHCIPTDEFRKTIGCLEFLIQRQAQSRGILVGELDCLQHLVNRIPLQSFELSMGTNNGNFLRELYGATFFPMKHGAILLAQLAGNHARRAETPLTRSTPLWRREWGRLVTTTFTGPLGARSRFTSALSMAAPISSERIGRNQYVAYRRHSVSGVARDSARRVSEQMYCASFSASRSVKLRAACVNTSCTVSIASLSHNSAAIDMKRRANLSCMDVKEMVSLACSHRCGRAPRCSGWKKTLA